MLTAHRKVFRYRCDHCKKLIPTKKEEEDMVVVDGTQYADLDGRDYHFCNRSQWDKFFMARYQTVMGFD